MQNYQLLRLACCIHHAVLQGQMSRPLHLMVHCDFIVLEVARTKLAIAAKKTKPTMKSWEEALGGLEYKIICENSMGEVLIMTTFPFASKCLDFVKIHVSGLSMYEFALVTVLQAGPVVLHESIDSKSKGSC